MNRVNYEKYYRNLIQTIADLKTKKAILKYVNPDHFSDIIRFKKLEAYGAQIRLYDRLRKRVWHLMDMAR